tara:strand:- start:886 stop:1053 length:168 start_codon:yes stop_codon:yes gene_type:complete
MYEDCDMRDSIANGTSIAGLGMVFMNWETPLTILILLTGVILNIIRIYDWWKRRS